jgi:lambda repressor-like predicted transcriptional regulator
MELERNPNTRHRLDGQEMLERDERVARLREQGVPFRVIAVQLGCSLGSVQKAVGRVEARRAERMLAVAAGVDDQPVGAVRFVGVDLRVELFADERGRRFNLLDLYRHTRIDGGALFGDSMRQLEEAGRAH